MLTDETDDTFPIAMTDTATELDQRGGAFVRIDAATLRPISASSGVERLLGEEPGRWSGRPDSWQRLFDPGDWQHVTSVCHAVARDGIVRRLRHMVRLERGGSRWFRTSIALLAGADPRALLAHMIDLGEEGDAADLAVLRSWVREVMQDAPLVDRWQLLAEQAPVAVYIVDRDLRFVSGLGADLAALGIRRASTGPVPLERLFGASDSGLALLELHRRALAGEALRSETCWLGRSYELTLQPLRDHGDAIAGVVGVAVDVTEHRRHEHDVERLLDSERVAHSAADAAVLARDQFLSIAAHELRTPLSCLRATLQQTLRQVRAGETPAGRILQGLERAERQTLRLGSLVESLLDGSSLSAGGRLQLVRQEVDLQALIQQVADRFDTDLQRSHTPLKVSTPESIVGYWDGSRIDQMISNLLANAIKYGAGHEVEISASMVGVGRARVAVRDHGIGIKADEVPRIFRPFQRLHKAQHYGGLGLGLFIVAEIAHAHDGEVRVESAPDEGTRFIVELPTRLPGGSPNGAS